MASSPLPKLQEVHTYLLKEYENNPEFKAKLDYLQEKYRQKLSNEWYGLGINDKSDEFLNEFLSNSYFRSELKKIDKNLFQRIWEVISSIIKSFFGKDSNQLPKDLRDLQTYTINFI